jgi:hypothetical protein
MYIVSTCLFLGIGYERGGEERTMGLDEDSSIA